jgi:hypothetical protein
MVAAIGTRACLMEQRIQTPFRLSLYRANLSLSLSLSLPLSLYPSLFNGKSATVAPALTNNKLLA